MSTVLVQEAITMLPTEMSVSQAVSAVLVASDPVSATSTSQVTEIPFESRGGEVDPQRMTVVLRLLRMKNRTQHKRGVGIFSRVLGVVCWVQ